MRLAITGANRTPWWCTSTHAELVRNRQFEDSQRARRQRAKPCVSGAIQRKGVPCTRDESQADRAAEVEEQPGGPGRNACARVADAPRSYAFAH